MAAYKVTNLDAPIEADYWVDIPIRDPDTNKDMVDEEGRILVQRHVTRTIKQNEYQGIVNKIPTYDNLVTSYNTYVTENNRQVHLISEMATTATNNVTKLTETVNNHDSQIHALYTKINAIQGIDIDDFKLVTETNIKNIKKSYLPLAGGTLTGAVTINNNLKVTGTVTSTFHGNLTGNVVGNVTGNITGSAKSATNDSVNRSIVNTYALKGNYPDRIKFGWDTTHKNYVNVTVDAITWGLITTGNISSQSVNHAKTSDKANSADIAKKATSADYATNSTNAVKATSATNANHATSADSATNANHAKTADSATTATTAAKANMLTGFASSNPNITWGVKTGTPVMAMYDSTGGSVGYRRDCPSKGKLSMVIDGYIYQNEGQYQVIDTNTIGSQHVASANSSTNANHATSATTATKASQNAAGYSLANTIVKAISIRGRTITVTKLDGQTYTLITQDTNTTYSKLSQFTNDSGYITDDHNFTRGVKVNGYTITVG